MNICVDGATEGCNGKLGTVTHVGVGIPREENTEADFLSTACLGQ